MDVYYTVGMKTRSFREQAGDLIGSAHGDGRPADLTARKKHYLKAWGYGLAGQACRGKTAGHSLPLPDGSAANGSVQLFHND